MAIQPLTDQDRLELHAEIEKRTQGHVIVKPRLGRDFLRFYVAYVLPSGTPERFPPILDQERALAWVTAENMDDAYRGLARSVGLAPGPNS